MSKTTLSLQELREYRLQLQSLMDPLKEKITELEAEALRPPVGITTNSDKMPAHDADPETRDAEDQAALAILGSEQHILAEVTEALVRLDQGRFGACEKCGHAIAKARLDAVPYARNCIKCAREAGA